MIVLILDIILITFLNNKMSIFEEYGAFKHHDMPDNGGIPSITIQIMGSKFFPLGIL